jgi:hypothetical protein
MANWLQRTFTSSLYFRTSMLRSGARLNMPNYLHFLLVRRAAKDRATMTEMQMQFPSREPDMLRVHSTCV